MTRPLFFGPADAVRAAVPGAVFVLGGDEGRHAATVRRLAEGEHVDVSDGAGYRLGGVIASVGSGTVEVAVESAGQDPVPQHRLVLVQALAKGGRDEQAVEAATELGVDAVVPWHAERSIVRWRGDRAAKAERKWLNTLIAATKQARRSRIPALGAVADRAGVVARIESADLALVLHESAKQPLSAMDAGSLPASGQVVLIVGPEGGISPDELAAFVGAGAQSVRLGSTVLRTSTAGSAAIAVLSSLCRWRD